MFQWLVSVDEQDRRADGLGALCHFAVEQGPEPVRLELALIADPTVADPPALALISPPGGCRLEVPAVDSGSPFRYLVVVEPPADSSAEDEITIDLADTARQRVPPCRIILRRARCVIQTALVQGDGSQPALSPQTRAALLWRGWRRYAELVAVKRFGTGRSGSAVLVFRPRLQQPELPAEAAAGSGPHELLNQSWGSWLLVKSGPAALVRREWHRSRGFLTDRLHPYMAHCEDYLPIRPAGASSGDQVTLISSFLGGDLLHTEPLEQLLRGTSEISQCQRLLERIFAILAPWYAAGASHPLGEWGWVYRGTRKDWLLFGKYDLTQETSSAGRRGRDAYTAGLCWDTSFITREHLHHHLFGRQRDGLLYRLRDQVVARFSLTHGDLNARNVLCDRSDAWLIDFEHTGVSPTLADFTWLEVNLRMGSLDLSPSGEDLENAALAFEQHLLDNFHGSEGGLSPVRALAPSLGAEPEELVKLAHCIAHIRRLTLPYFQALPAGRGICCNQPTASGRWRRWPRTGACSRVNSTTSTFLTTHYSSWLTLRPYWRRRWMDFSTRPSWTGRWPRLCQLRESTCCPFRNLRPTRCRPLCRTWRHLMTRCGPS
jgi:hypothetical protein